MGKQSVLFLGLGNEFERVSLDVIYIAEFARGVGGKCAFCDGDPCNERKVADSVIARFYRANPRAPTCPVCDGRPT